MSAQQVENLSRIYCPTHKTSFSAPAAGNIVCQSGGHALARDFPHDGFWEYCCDCQCFRPSEIGLTGRAAANCLVCEREIVRRHLCDRCEVISVESDEPAKRRKAFAIAGGGGVEPGCPACGREASAGDVRMHRCADVEVLLSTARATCPFCDEPTAPPAPPPAAEPPPAAAKAAHGAQGVETRPLAASLQCPACGAESRPGHSFCGKCGASVAAAAHQPRPTHHDAATLDLTPLDLPPLPQADAFQTQTLPPAAPAAPRSRRGLVVVACAVLGLIVVIIVLASIPRPSRRGVTVPGSSSYESTETKLDRAIERGELVSPPSTSAYDYYQQLKRENASASKLSGYTQQLLPKLTARPQSLLDELYRPGGSDGEMSDWAEASRLMAWASELNPGDRSLAARAAYCAGRVAFLNKDWDTALPLLQKARDMDRSWVVPVNTLGLAHRDLKQFDTALSYFEEAVQLDPDWAVPYNNLGSWYMRKGNFSAAENYYLQAVERAPRWGRPHAWLGDIAVRNGNYQRAADEYKAVLDLTPAGTPGWDLVEIRQKYEDALAKARSY